MDLGTCIIIGCTILGTIIGTVIAILKLFPKKNNPNKYVLQKVCDERLITFNQSVSFIKEGIKELNKNVIRMHERIDKVLGNK